MDTNATTGATTGKSTSAEPTSAGSNSAGTNSADVTDAAAASSGAGSASTDATSAESDAVSDPAQPSPAEAPAATLDAPPVAEPVVVETARRGVSVPVFLATAVVVAALTAAFATIWVLHTDLEAQEEAVAQLEAEASALEADVSENAAALAGATARVAALEDRLGSSGGATGSASDTGEAPGEAPSDGQPIGDGLPPFSGNGQPDAAIGRPLPDVSGTDFLTGADVAPAEGSPTMVMVWAHWCPYCQQELPNVQALVDEGVFAANGVELMTIATFEDPTRGNPFEEYVEEFSFPVIRDDRNRAAQLGFTGVPSWVIVGADGNVVGRISGLLGEDVLRGVIERVAAESS